MVIDTGSEEQPAARSASWSVPADYREPDAPLQVPPAFPERGAPGFLTFNSAEATEIVFAYLQSIMPPDTAGAFSAFGWDAVNVVVQGLVEI